MCSPRPPSIMSCGKSFSSWKGGPVSRIVRRAPTPSNPHRYESVRARGGARVADQFAEDELRGIDVGVSPADSRRCLTKACRSAQAAAALLDSKCQSAGAVAIGAAYVICSRTYRATLKIGRVWSLLWLGSR